MSNYQNGQGADPLASIRRARKRAAAGGQRESYNTFIRKANEQQQQEQDQQQQQQAPSQNGQRSAIPVRRPGPTGPAAAAPAPVWPLSDSPVSPTSDAESYGPPPRQVQPPRRPQRPSRVPSILDASKNQYYPPAAYAYEAAQDYPVESLQPPPAIGSGSRASDLSLGQPSVYSSASRGSTISSVGSIPDFPVPVSAVPAAIPEPPPAAVVPPPRRSINLGPPPSARRGASSFYSTSSFVSPIPEESPGSRSNASVARRWDPSSYTEPGTFYGDMAEARSETPPSSSDGETSPHGDRRSLVNRESADDDADYNTAFPLPPDFNAPTARSTPRSSLTANSILKAFDVASSVDPMRTARRSSASRYNGSDDLDAGRKQPYDRMSTLRRPPRLDIDAVRQAEARGSLTSLPDLIRRATRVAESLGRGKRPASAADDLSIATGMYGRGVGRDAEGNAEKYQSGLSDMLAAFPPPGQQPNPRGGRRSFREQIASWPMPHQYRDDGKENNEDSEYAGQDGKGGSRQRKERRCCGLPLWVFIIAVLVTVVVVAAAVIIPVEFFVVHKPASRKMPVTMCSSQVSCANGGTSVMSSDGHCSCICINNFTGANCTVAGDKACTLTSLAPTLSNVTLGTAIPRLLQQAQANYSIALSATEILSTFNDGNLSCAFENALVTFDGESVRQSSSGSTEVYAFNAAEGVAVADSDAGVVTVTVTASADAGLRRRTDVPTTTSSSTQGVTASTSSVSLSPAATLTVTTTVTPRATASTTATTATDGARSEANGAAGATSTASSATPAATFAVTEDILDFARVAVLFILQQESIESAEGAQSALQRFFSNATTAAKKQQSVTAVARNITLPNGNSIDLVNLQVSAGSTLAGAGHK